MKLIKELEMAALTTDSTYHMLLFRRASACIHNLVAVADRPIYDPEPEVSEKLDIRATSGDRL